MYLLLILSTLLGSLNGVVLNKARLDGNQVYRYNLFGTVVWCIGLFFVNGCTLNLNSDVVLWAILYGVVQTLFNFFKTKAMNTGPVSITTLIGNCSLVISVVACFIFWDEKIGLIDVIGLAVLLCGIFLATYKRPSKDTGESYNTKWLVYSAFYFVLAACVGLVFKAFSKSASPEMTGDMMLLSSIVMLISYTVVCIFTGAFKMTNKENAKEQSRDIQKMFIIYALLSGLISCAYNRLNIFLAGQLPGVIFYPSFNGGGLLLSVVWSIILLREKLSRKQLVGIFIGALGICIIGIF